MIAALKNTKVENVPTQSSNSFAAQIAVSNLALFNTSTVMFPDPIAFSPKFKTNRS